MENFNPKKRYNQFRLARRKRNKFAVGEINTDEATGRHYKLERFLRDCVIYLPKEAAKPAVETEPGIEDEPAVATPKPKKSKHIKLPVLNECRGIFENVIIGRSAKKAENFGVGATPEDRARLKEDIHALAKVGPDSELSFEMIPPTQQQREIDLQNTEVNRPLEEPEANQETQQAVLVTSSSPNKESAAVGITPVPAVTEKTHVEYHSDGAFPEDFEQPCHENYIIEEEKEETVPADARNPSLSTGDYHDAEMCDNNILADSGFEGLFPGHREEEEGNPGRASHHCKCCRKSAFGKRSFFDTEAILKSNEASWEDGGANEIFGNQKDPSGEALKGGWLFENGVVGPSNFLGSTYPPPGPSEFDFKGIQIQSGRPREVLANHGVDYCGSRSPTVSLKCRSRWIDLNKEARNYLRKDPANNRKFPSDDVFHHLSPYNKYRYDRSLSPRKY